MVFGIDFHFINGHVHHKDFFFLYRRNSGQEPKMCIFFMKCIKSHPLIAFICKISIKNNKKLEIKVFLRVFIRSVLNHKNLSKVIVPRLSYPDVYVV